MDAEIAASASALETTYDLRPDTIRVLRCHRGRVKRLVTEESPDIFLTVAEVGCGHCALIMHINRLIKGWDGKTARFTIPPRLW